MVDLTREIIVRMVLSNKLSQRNIIIAKVLYYASECVDSAIQGNRYDFENMFEALDEMVVVATKNKEVMYFVEKLLVEFLWLFKGDYTDSIEEWSYCEIFDSEFQAELTHYIDNFLLPNE